MFSINTWLVKAQCLYGEISIADSSILSLNWEITALFFTSQASSEAYLIFIK